MSKIYCPVLEFRLVSKLHAQRHGEIIDASLNIAVGVDQNQVDPELRGAAQRHRGKRKGKRRGNDVVKQLLDEDLPEQAEWAVAQKKVKLILVNSSLDKQYERACILTRLWLASQVLPIPMPTRCMRKKFTIMWISVLATLLRYSVS